MSRSRCSGCFPRFQENQLAHMELGGCMFTREDEICRDLSIDFEKAITPCVTSWAEKVLAVADALSDEVDDDVAKESTAEQTECCICYEMIGEKNNCVTECGHKFCFKCLMTAMARKNSCPCCRAPLTDVPNQEEEDEEDDDDEYDDDESDDEDEYVMDELAPVETIVERLEKNGFTMLDLVSIILHRRSKIDSKYTEEFIEELTEKFDEIQIDADNEADEQRGFAAEDTRA